MQTSHSLVRPGSCVAFTHGTDSIVLLAEVRRELSPSERSFVTTDIKQVSSLSSIIYYIVYFLFSVFVIFY